jgi:hypothetical protein
MRIFISISVAHELELVYFVFLSFTFIIQKYVELTFDQDNMKKKSYLPIRLSLLRILIINLKKLLREYNTASINCSSFYETKKCQENTLTQTYSTQDTTNFYT